MFFKNLTVASTVTVFLFASCNVEEATPDGASNSVLKRTDEPQPCYACDDLIVGSYFFDDTGQPLQPGNDLLSINIDWGNDEVIFRSAEHKFCELPPKVWTYTNFGLQDLLPYAYAPVPIEATLSFDKHELILGFDPVMLQCAFESEMSGFKFALPIY